MVYIHETSRILKDGQTVVYLYLAHNIRKNGVTVKDWMIPLGRKEDAIVKLKEIAKTQKSLFPTEGDHAASALLYVYLELFRELGLIEIVNQVTEKKRDQGITPGLYLLICILNRLTCPKSTKELQDWFSETVLKDIYPDAAQFLTPQHIWNHFQYFDEKDLQDIFLQLVLKVRKSYGPTLNTLLLDSTNFYTYITDHPNNTLPKRGHGKEGRKHLNIVNFALLLDEAKECPIYYKSYPGNVPDSDHMKTFLPEMDQWFNKLDPASLKPDITLVFDKGNNSEDAMKIIEENKWGFVGSLRPSMFKELLQEPYTEFSKIYDTKKGHPVYAFRRTAKVYTDTPCVIIVTFDEHVHNKSLHTLNYHLAKKFDLLDEFSIQKLNTKPQWQNPEKIKAHIDSQILEYKDFKEMIHVIIEQVEAAAVATQELRWGLNADRIQVETNTFGKSIIFSNRIEMSTKDIVLKYRQQFKIESKFAEMKDPAYIQTRPIRHWTDHNIHVHLFICLLAVLGQSLLKLKLKALRIDNPFSKVVAALDVLHKIYLFSGSDSTKYVIPPKMTALQKTLVSKFDLEPFLNH